MSEIALQVEYAELERWTRKFRRKDAHRRSMDLCRLCGTLIRIGYVYCQKCQEKIDGEEDP
jgi:formamidopyrimidine-DNA glycosylase